MSIALTQNRTTAVSSAPRAGAQTSSDETLIARIARGDTTAMRTFFVRHQVRIYRFALRIVREEALAEDVLGEVFLAVWCRAAQFEARAAVSTWLLSVARNKALSLLRRRGELELGGDTALSIVDPTDDPEITLQKKNSGQVLRRCLAMLSSEHRQIIDLVYYHGCSVRQVAEILGILEPTVKTRMFYARKRLAKLIQAAERQHPRADAGIVGGEIS
jgi:RNA polymerase sigma-70 factor, ECF subfamily